MDSSAKNRLLAAAALAWLLCSCASDSTGAEADLPSEPAADSSATRATEPADGAGSRLSPRLVRDRGARVDPDLDRLVERFVSYAVGRSDSFPHRESVSLSLGGQTVVYIDHFEVALSSHETWKTCPGDWEVYGASSCPVDLLAPVRNAAVNGAEIVYSTTYGDVACAPTRSGPLPRGRLVVLRPGQEWRTCATDFALALVADRRGRLRSVDLTLAEP